jgi:hypothetical protein
MYYIWLEEGRGPIKLDLDSLFLDPKTYIILLPNLTFGVVFLLSQVI